MQWMAPELLDPADESQATPTIQSDVYSFGCLTLQVRDSWVRLHSDSHMIC